MQQGTKRPASEPNSPSKIGFAGLSSDKEFEKFYGPLPRGFPRFWGDFFDPTLAVGKDVSMLHYAEPMPILGPDVEDKLLELASWPVSQFRNFVMAPPTYEKPRYLLMYHLLVRIASLHESSLLLAEVPLRKEEEAEEEADAGFEAKQGAVGAAGGVAAPSSQDDLSPGSSPRGGDRPSDEDGRLVLGYEHYIKGENARGLVEFVLLRPRSAVARQRARQLELWEAIQDDCVAAMLIELKTLVAQRNIWQPFAAAIELARRNHDVAGSASAPVSILLTDAFSWFFLTVELIKPGEGAQQVPDSRAGLLFSLTRKSGQVDTFRLYNCASVDASILAECPTHGLGVVQVLYRLYTTMFPDQDISQLATQTQQGDKWLKQQASQWKRSVVWSLKQERAANSELQATRRLLQQQEEIFRQEVEAARQREAALAEAARQREVALAEAARQREVALAEAARQREAALQQQIDELLRAQVPAPPRSE